MSALYPNTLKLTAIALATALWTSAAASAQDINLTIGSELEDKRAEYGTRDVDQLTVQLLEEVSESLDAAGAAEGLTINIVLEDAWPNRPTRGQLAANPGLSYRSLSLGGASLTAVILDGEGTVVGEVDYRWRTHSITDSASRGTWHDADRAFSRFARELAEQVDTAQAS